MMLDYIDAVSFAPDRELLSCRRPERIRRGEHDSLALFFETMRQLADGRRLAAAVDTDHQDDQRRIRTQLLRISLIDDRGHDALQCLRHFLRLRDMFFFDCLAELLHDLHRSIHADIGGNQHFFQLIHQVFIDLTAQHDGICNSFGKSAEKRFFFFK